MNATIRPSAPSDRDAIAALHEEAFGGTDEARLAIALLEDESDAITLVAEDGGAVVGHVLLSRIEGPEGALALAPLAVSPRRQRNGIGSALVAAGLEQARMDGWQAVFVLGDLLFYGRFGFRAASATSADVPWAGPHFAALELVPDALSAPIGRLTYPPAFSRL